MTFDDYYDLQILELIVRSNVYNSPNYPPFSLQTDNYATALQFYNAIPIAASEKKLLKYLNLFNAEPIYSNDDQVITIDFKDSVIKNKLPEIWVKRNFEDYRDAFIDMLSNKLNIKDQIPKNYDVDHFFSKEQLRDSEKYIRLILLDRSPNRSHGASFEKAFASLDWEYKNDPINVDGQTFLKGIGEKYTKRIRKNKKQNESLINELVKDGIASTKDIAKLILDELYKLAFPNS